MKLTDLVPLKEGKHKQLEREVKNLAGVVKIDFSEALEVLQEDGVLEAMDNLENAIDILTKIYFSSRCFTLIN